MGIALLGGGGNKVSVPFLGYCLVGMRLFCILLPLFAFAAGPEYSADGHLKFPERYREWVFLSSGLGMTYGTPDPNQTQRFDNVFVNPEAYREFLKTGRWPDKSVFVLEIRAAEDHISINQAGKTQGAVSAVEVEVKDSKAKTGLWTFFDFPAGPGSTAKAIPADARCYQCHGKNTGVENTFVQFYPNLIEVARKKGTLKPEFAK